VQNRPKIMSAKLGVRSARPFASGTKRPTSGIARHDTMNVRTARRSYERYIALAEAHAQSDNIIGAESYYQHAEHYFRQMSSTAIAEMDDERQSARSADS
jgi:Domain of unknown function (DUF4167)